ncbi:transglycosylase domain-containing protein [Paraclostridium tenue]|nr:biosynthetic peptidoglycan transglycosylase [[Eubacterium] tenue]MBC8632430.1 transglycosylase domain-containing protein [[Eubacterium] tenue]MDU1539247.1 biosynthetic peptidoglycan transglycosylase [Paeniclostridium sordellii]
MSYYDDEKNKIRRKKVSSNNTSSRSQTNHKRVENKTENKQTNNNRNNYSSKGKRANKGRAKKKKKSKRFVSIIKKLLIFLLIISFIGAISANVIMNIALKDSPKPTYAYMKEKSVSSEYVSISKIPVDLQHAIVSIEDERFFDHKGVDYLSLTRSVVHNIFSKSTQGGSTLEMQVSKNLLTSMDQTIKRKIKDIYNARQMDKNMNKREILELYLNNMYLGKGIYGAQKGAQVYFGKDVSELNLGECALLAGITNRPGLYSKDYNAAKKRRDIILYKMQELGYITKDEYEKAKKEETPMNIK